MKKTGKDSRWVIFALKKRGKEAVFGTDSMPIRQRDHSPVTSSVIPGIVTTETGCPGANRGRLIAKPRIHESSKVGCRTVGAFRHDET